MRTLLSVVLGACLLAVALPASAQARLTTFRSPTGNIGCSIDSTYGARCDIRKHDWRTPAKPSSCEFDYGQGLYVRGGRGAFVCAGDTALGARSVLAYGRTRTVGHFQCRSLTSGMKCANTSTGHGFFLSIQKYNRF